jgi:predicted nucleic acid-binding Zn ribbon protein
MPTYVYETIPQTESDAALRFEVRQSMNDKPLTQHPETGAPVRRLISGGTGVMGGSTAAPSAPRGGGGCGTGCGCH